MAALYLSKVHCFFWFFFEHPDKLSRRASRTCHLVIFSLFYFCWQILRRERSGLGVLRSAVSMVESGMSGLVTFRARQAIEDGYLRLKLDLWVGSQGLGCLKLFPSVKVWGELKQLGEYLVFDATLCARVFGR